MTAEARDMIALMQLELELSQLRESYMENVFGKGILPSAEKWALHEQAARKRIRERFYSDDVRQSVKPNEPLSDEEDFDSRIQKDLTEPTLWWTHDMLKNIPFHGHPDYRTA